MYDLKGKYAGWSCVFFVSELVKTNQTNVRILGIKKIF
jgi:hypothetical protein